MRNEATLVSGVRLYSHSSSRGSCNPISANLRTKRIYFQTLKLLIFLRSRWISNDSNELVINVSLKKVSLLKFEIKLSGYWILEMFCKKNNCTSGTHQSQLVFRKNYLHEYCILYNRELLNTKKKGLAECSCASWPVKIISPVEGFENIHSESLWRRASKR